MGKIHIEDGIISSSDYINWYSGSHKMRNISMHAWNDLTPRTLVWSTNTTIAFGTQVVDTANAFDGTNFIVPSDGTYLIDWAVAIGNYISGTWIDNTGVVWISSWIMIDDALPSDARLLNDNTLRTYTGTGSSGMNSSILFGRYISASIMRELKGGQKLTWVVDIRNGTTQNAFTRSTNLKYTYVSIVKLADHEVS